MHYLPFIQLNFIKKSIKQKSVSVVRSGQCRRSFCHWMNSRKSGRLREYLYACCKLLKVLDICLYFVYTLQTHLKRFPHDIATYYCLYENLSCWKDNVAVIIWFPANLLKKSMEGKMSSLIRSGQCQRSCCHWMNSRKSDRLRKYLYACCKLLKV